MLKAKTNQTLALFLVFVLLLTSVPGLAVAMEEENPTTFSTEQMITAAEIEEYLLTGENRLNADLLAEDLFFYLEPCEQIPSSATLVPRGESRRFSLGHPAGGFFVLWAGSVYSGKSSLS
jgi:hypothetical protein